MTDSTHLRRRRRPDPNALPDELVKWFETGGSAEAPWCALLSPGYEQLHANWLKWAKGRTLAAPPSVQLMLLMGFDPRPGSGLLVPDTGN